MTAPRTVNDDGSIDGGDFAPVLIAADQLDKAFAFGWRIYGEYSGKPGLYEVYRPFPAAIEPDDARRHRENRAIERATQLLTAAGYVVRSPEELDFPVTSRRTGSFQKAPYRIEQQFDVKVGDRIARLYYSFDPVGSSYPPHVLAGPIVALLAKAIVEPLRSAIEGELRWLSREPS